MTLGKANDAPEAIDFFVQRYTIDHSIPFIYLHDLAILCEFDLDIMLFIAVDEGVITLIDQWTGEPVDPYGKIINPVNPVHPVKEEQPC